METKGLSSLHCPFFLFYASPPHICMGLMDAYKRLVLTETQYAAHWLSLTQTELWSDYLITENMTLDNVTMTMSLNPVQK